LLIAGGITCVYLDSRAQGAFALASAVALWSRSGPSPRGAGNGAAYVRLLAVGTLLLVVLLVAVAKTQTTYGDRRDQSNTDRFTALAISLRAITKSPVIGYGSWGQGTDAYAEDLERSLIASGQQSFRTDIFVAHSQLLQSWMEGGLFAATFFIVYGYYLLRNLLYVSLQRRADGLTPLFAFVLTMATWHLFMSPFGGDHRLQIAVGIAVICALEKERRDPAVKAANSLGAELPAVIRFPNLLR
jgi:O-antigen ligase